MSMTVSRSGGEDTTLEGTLTLEAPNRRAEASTERMSGREEEDERNRLKQRLLAAGKIAPKSAAEKEERRRQEEQEMREAMRVSFEEGGQEIDTTRRPSSMEMDAMQFRRIKEADESRTLQRIAALERADDRARASRVEREVRTVTPEDEGERRDLREEQRSGSSGDHALKATSKASSSTRVQEEGLQQGGVLRSGSGGDQVPQTTSLPSSSTSVAAGEASAGSIRDEVNLENDMALRDQKKIPENPWNAFQQANRGRGWSQQRMQEEYWSQKGRGKGDKSRKP